MRLWPRPGRAPDRASPEPRRRNRRSPLIASMGRSTWRLPQICKCSGQDHNGMRGTYPGPAAAHGDVFLPMNRIAADLARVGVVAALPLGAEIGVDGHLRSGSGCVAHSHSGRCDGAGGVATAHHYRREQEVIRNATGAGHRSCHLAKRRGICQDERVDASDREPRSARRGSRQQSRAQRRSAGRSHRWGRCHGRGCGGDCAACHGADADDHRDHGSHGCHDPAHTGSGHDVVPEPWTWLVRALPVTDWSPESNGPLDRIGTGVWLCREPGISLCGRTRS